MSEKTKPQIRLNAEHKSEVFAFATACNAPVNVFYDAVIAYMEAGDSYKTAIIKSNNVFFNPAITMDIKPWENPEIDNRNEL